MDPYGSSGMNISKARGVTVQDVAPRVTASRGTQRGPPIVPWIPWTQEQLAACHATLHRWGQPQRIRERRVVRSPASHIQEVLALAQELRPQLEWLGQGEQLNRSLRMEVVGALTTATTNNYQPGLECALAVLETVKPPIFTSEAEWVGLVIENCSTDALAAVAVGTGRLNAEALDALRKRSIAGPEALRAVVRELQSFLMFWGSPPPPSRPDLLQRLVPILGCLPELFASPSVGTYEALQLYESLTEQTGRLPEETVDHSGIEASILDSFDGSNVSVLELEGRLRDRLLLKVTGSIARHSATELQETLKAPRQFSREELNDALSHRFATLRDGLSGAAFVQDLLPLAHCALLLSGDRLARLESLERRLEDLFDGSAGLRPELVRQAHALRTGLPSAWFPNLFGSSLEDSSARQSQRREALVAACCRHIDRGEAAELLRDFEALGILRRCGLLSQEQIRRVRARSGRLPALVSEALSGLNRKDRESVERARDQLLSLATFADAAVRTQVARTHTFPLIVRAQRMRRELFMKSRFPKSNPKQYPTVFDEHPDPIVDAQLKAISELMMSNTLWYDCVQPIEHELLWHQARTGVSHHEALRALVARRARRHGLPQELLMVDHEIEDPEEWARTATHFFYETAPKPFDERRHGRAVHILQRLAMMEYLEKLRTSSEPPAPRHRLLHGAPAPHNLEALFAAVVTYWMFLVDAVAIEQDEGAPRCFNCASIMTLDFAPGLIPPDDRLPFEPDRPMVYPLS